MGWAVPQANDWEGCCSYFKGRGRDFQELGHCPFLAFYGQPQNCHGACGPLVECASVLQ